MMRWDGQDEKSAADTSNVSRSDGSPFHAKLPVGGYLGSVHASLVPRLWGKQVPARTGRYLEW